MGLSVKEIFTEEEAINITIQHGYNGSETETSVWKKRGCLSTNRTMDGLIKKLETIFTFVSVEGKGKKRKYILRGKKEKVTERKYNYRGTVPSKEDNIIKEYIFYLLCKYGNGKALTFNRWEEEFNLFKPNKLKSTEDLIEKVKGLHYEIFINSKEIVSEFFNAFKNYNYSIVMHAFNRLENEGRINKTSIYVFESPKGEQKQVIQEEYEEIHLYKKSFIESLGVEYKHYVLSYRSFHKTERMIEVIKLVDEEIIKQFNVKRMYELVKVSVLDKSIKELVSKDEFENAYFKKFINRAKNRQNRTSYQNSTSFWRRNYLLNTVVLLSFLLESLLEIDELKEILEKELNKHQQMKDFELID